jgi:hypothetical protein
LFRKQTGRDQINLTESDDYYRIARKRLTHLGLGHWEVLWVPRSGSPVKGRAIPEKMLIEIYDIDPTDAMDTLLHEVVEIKLRDSIRPYRVLVNKLIEGYQEITDAEKDKFIESLPLIFEVFQDSPQDV